MSRRTGHLQDFLCSVPQPMHPTHRKFCLDPSTAWLKQGKALPPDVHCLCLGRSHPLPKKQQSALSGSGDLVVGSTIPSMSLCLPPQSLPCRAQEGTATNFKMWFLGLAKGHPHGPPAHAPSSISMRGKWLSCATTTALELGNTLQHHWIPLAIC